MSNHKLLYGYPFILFLYSLYSYSQVLPNLVLTSNQYFWQFQQYLWQLGYHNRLISTILFTLIAGLSYIFYWLLLSVIKKKQIFLPQVILLFALCVGALLPSYNALSGDVFNYLMNAKIIHVYHASPYTHAAWNFPSDPWLNFMMNVHTTTPYGYIWTGLGYLIYQLSFGSLQFGMLAFRILSIVSVAIIGWSIWTINSKNKLWTVAFFIFNPLVLFEAVNNAHNDIVMMAFFIGGIALFVKLRPKNLILAILTLFIGWLLSVYTKLITVIAPIVVSLQYIIRHKIPWFNWADALTLSFIAVMFMDGSKRFFPWYLLWALSVAPLAQSNFTKKLIGLFSLTATFSYIFYLYLGEYSQLQGNMRIGLLFSLPLIYAGWQTMKLLPLNMSGRK